MKRLINLSLIALVTAPASAYATDYLLTDLGSFPTAQSDQGYRLTAPWGLNNLGEVVGQTCPDEPWGGESCLGFIWSQCRQEWLGPETVGASSVFLVDINDLGQVIGFAGPAHDGFLYLPEPAYGLQAGVHGIDTFAQGLGMPSDINNAGQIVGATALFDPTVGIIELGSLGGGATGAAMVNDVGQVVGRSNTAEGLTHAFLWENGIMIDLGTMGAQTSEAVGINNSGQIVGTNRTEEGSIRAIRWIDQVPSALPTPPGVQTATVSGINDSGQILGKIRFTDGAASIVLWEGENVVDLTPHFAPYSSRNCLMSARLNNAGQVIAFTCHMALRGLLLTPTHGDCNGNGVQDSFDISNRTSRDLNSNWVPDECDIALCRGIDCNGNGVLDDHEVITGPDCNDNGIPDACDIAAQVSSDCNFNGIPDECNDVPDCNMNHAADACDMLYATVIDCDQNGQPDICQYDPYFGGEYGADCDANDVLDLCQGEEFNRDCDGNGMADGCGIAVGLVPDCNNNLWPDSCDVESQTSCDFDADGVPDECQTWPPCDFDHGGEVNLTDYAAFTTCASAPCETPPCSPFLFDDPCCVVGDTDNDGDIDLADFAVLQTSFGG